MSKEYCFMQNVYRAMRTLKITKSTAEKFTKWKMKNYRDLRSEGMTLQTCWNIFSSMNKPKKTYFKHELPIKLIERKNKFSSGRLKDALAYLKFEKPYKKHDILKVVEFLIWKDRNFKGAGLKTEVLWAKYLQVCNINSATNAPPKQTPTTEPERFYPSSSIQKSIEEFNSENNRLKRRNHDLQNENTVLTRLL